MMFVVLMLLLVVMMMTVAARFARVVHISEDGGVPPFLQGKHRNGFRQSHVALALSKNRTKPNSSFYTCITVSLLALAVFETRAIAAEGHEPRAQLGASAVERHARVVGRDAECRCGFRHRLVLQFDAPK